MFRSIAITLALCFAAVTAQAALLGRAALTPGGTDYQAYYDDVLNITWLADANLAATNDFGVAIDTVYGAMRWPTANTWIGAMNTANYLGISTWRLPAVNPVDGSSFDYTPHYDGSSDIGYNISAPDSAYPGSTGSEMAHMYYSTLGNIGYLDTGGSYTGCARIGSSHCLTNYGPFSNLPSTFWSTIYPPASNEAWIFSYYFGEQKPFDTQDKFFAWAVSDGDMLAAVPVPAAVWLFGSALGLMGWMRRKVS
jgi:hypothetical protein